MTSIDRLVGTVRKRLLRYAPAHDDGRVTNEADLDALVALDELEKLARAEAAEARVSELARHLRNIIPIADSHLHLSHKDERLIEAARDTLSGGRPNAHSETTDPPNLASGDVARGEGDGQRNPRDAAARGLPERPPLSSAALAADRTEERG